MPAKPKLRLVKDPFRNGGAINLARRVCADLESGEAIGVAVVAVTRSGFVATAWENPPGKSSHELHSGAHMLAHRIGRGLANSGD
jgi:hypothetical protein